MATQTRLNKDDLVLRISPQWAWETVDETLQNDMNSLAIDKELRVAIRSAAEAFVSMKLVTAAPKLRTALQAICDLPADDYGVREIPPGFLDNARALINASD